MKIQIHNQILCHFWKAMAEGTSTIHQESSSTKLNELVLHATFKYMFAAMTRAHFCEFALHLGRRELIMIFIEFYFFFITRARLMKSSEKTSGSLCPILFVPQWIIIYCREGGKDILFMLHSTFRILPPPILKLKVLNFEKCLWNIQLNLIKLAVTKINKTLYFFELITSYAWFLKVSYLHAFPLCGTGVIRKCIS